MYFAEFPSCVTKIPAYADSVILDCMLSLDSRLSNFPQRFVGTNFLSEVGLLDNHAAMFSRAQIRFISVHRTNLVIQSLFL